MNVEELSMIGPAVDLQTVDSIHKKRLLAFINHFVIGTASFLNKLGTSCEEKFMVFEERMQKLEAAVIILEGKLNSVPGLQEVDLGKPPEEKMETVEKVVEEVVEVVEQKEELDPVLSKYVKMLQVGVPPAAVKLKMSGDGIEESLHDSVLNSFR